MEYLWLTGVSVALAAFGIKTGIGLSSVIYDETRPLKAKSGFFFSTMLLYFLVFATGHFLMMNVSLIEHMGAFLNILKFGMTGHIIIAFGLIFWGIKLVSAVPGNTAQKKSISPYLLILPCPVCATAILLMTAMAHNLSSFTPLHTSSLLYAVFFLITLLTISLFFPFRSQIRKNSTGFLGVSMMGVGLYFILLLFLSPVYPAAKKVYAAALATHLPLFPEDAKMWAILPAVLFIFIIGVNRTIKQERNF